MQTIALDQLDLARLVRPGDGVIFQQGCGEALNLSEKFVAQRAAYSGASVFFGSGFSRSFALEHADHLRFSGIGGIGTLRKLASSGALDPIPCHISAIEGLLRQRIIRADVLMLQVSEPNERGEYSWGLVNDYVRTALQQARVVIAEVNRQMPWVPCERPLLAHEISVAVPT
ncbi:MAG: acetyl-CoA hydrolase, partial [Proteobacteria bacterium]|nr:acetyl-CoA hydrolase [Pseudomonadota bacterium]